MGLDSIFDDLPKVSVSQYTTAIKKALEGKIPPCWVVGEVSNLRRQASGHLYFSLKDAGSQLPAVMFRGQAASVSFALRDGVQVLAFGEISVYEPYGRYQLIVRQLVESGEGRLYREFERLKRKLAEEGLFEAERKKPLPLLPTRVAIVTSPTGAALQDFMRILKRRKWGGLLHVYPAKVQGQGAADEIVSMLDLANEAGNYDLVVLARGGGSIEDLWSFNEEKVARAIAASRLPVISGVGHEIDFTLSDFAADVRAETPSGAAELISSKYMDTLDRLEGAREELHNACWERLRDYAVALDGLRRDLKGTSPVGALERAFLRIDELGTRLDSLFSQAVNRHRSRAAQLERRFCSIDVASLVSRKGDRVARLSDAFRSGAKARVSDLRGRLEVLGAALRALSPDATLRRGFAMMETEAGTPISSVSAVQPPMSVRARLKDGHLEMTVDGVVPAEAGERSEES